MKIGIVGTGNISSRHLNEFNNMSNVNVEAVCDTNPKNLEIFLSNNKVTNIRYLFILIYRLILPIFKIAI